MPENYVHSANASALTVSADNVSVSAWFFAGLSAALYTQKKNTLAMIFLTISAVGRVLSVKNNTIDPCQNRVTAFPKKLELTLTLIAHLYYIAATGLTLYQYYSEDDSRWIKLFLGDLWNAIDGLIGGLHLCVLSSAKKAIPTKKALLNNHGIFDEFYINLAHKMNYSTKCEKIIVYASAHINTMMFLYAIINMHYKRPYNTLGQLFFSASMFLSGILSGYNLNKKTNHSPKIIITRKAGIRCYKIHSVSLRSLEQLVARLPDVDFSRISSDYLGASNNFLIALQESHVEEELMQMIDQSKEIMVALTDSNRDKTIEIADGLISLFSSGRKLHYAVKKNHTPELNRESMTSPLLAADNHRAHDWLTEIIPLTGLFYNAVDQLREKIKLSKGDDAGLFLCDGSTEDALEEGLSSMEFNERRLIRGPGEVLSCLIEIVKEVDVYIRSQVAQQCLDSADSEHADEEKQEISGACLQLTLILMRMQMMKPPGVDFDSSVSIPMPTNVAA